jgi:tRNA (guanine37-N1)-methyltransferase
MRCRALRVRTQDGEAARGRLVKLGWLHPDLKPALESDALLLPLSEDAPDEVDLRVPYEVVEADLPEREPKPTSLRDSPELDPEVAAEVTRSMDIVGDVAIIRLKDHLMGSRYHIGHVLMGIHPRLRAVAVDEGVHGPLRVRKLEKIAGEGPLVTEHREHGLRLKVDLERAYFSPRLATEHKRIADLVQEGERVLDMFTGVGPFAILAAKTGRPGEVHAVDLNPRAVELVRENAGINGVADLVVVHEGDAVELVPGLGTFDRIIMNHPHGAADLFHLAVDAARDGTVVHLHSIGRPDETEATVTGALGVASEKGWPGTRLMHQREVRTYGPGVLHFCSDIEVVTGG